MNPSFECADIRGRYKYNYACIHSLIVNVTIIYYFIIFPRPLVDVVCYVDQSSFLCSIVTVGC